MATKARNHRKFFNKSNYMLCSLFVSFLPPFGAELVLVLEYTYSVYPESRTNRVFLGDKIFLIYEKNSVYFLQQSCPLFVAFASRPGHRQKSVNIVLCYCAVLIIILLSTYGFDWLDLAGFTVIMVVT